MRLSDNDKLAVAFLCFGVAGLLAGFWLGATGSGLLFVGLGCVSIGLGIGKYRGRPK